MNIYTKEKVYRDKRPVFPEGTKEHIGKIVNVDKSYTTYGGLQTSILFIDIENVEDNSKDIFTYPLVGSSIYHSFMKELVKIKYRDDLNNLNRIVGRKIKVFVSPDNITRGLAAYIVK